MEGEGVNERGNARASERASEGGREGETDGPILLARIPLQRCVGRGQHAPAGINCILEDSLWHLANNPVEMLLEDLVECHKGCSQKHSHAPQNPLNSFSSFSAIP